ncbi:MAG: ExbD/TolR family protein [Gammaproteobacteria bacterium]
MRRNLIQAAVEEQNEIDMTPMLDVVFIMLIFFIVTANFVKEPGLEVSRPDSETAEQQENAGILVAVGQQGDVYMDGRRIDVRQVKANVLRLRAERPDAAVVIRADSLATADIITEVMDGIRAAGVRDISLAADPK